MYLGLFWYLDSNFNPMSPIRTPQEMSGYQQVAIVDHKELIEFVREGLKAQNLISISYWIFNLVFIGFTAFVFAHQLTAGEFAHWDDGLAHLGLGIAVAFLLVPIHEGIHGLVYKWLGAPKVQYTVNFRKFYFTAQADMFVISGREFLALAFAPFAVLTLTFFLLMIIFPNLVLFGCGVLIAHTAACSGDFGLAAFVFNYRKADLRTWDDFKAARSYFVVKDAK